MNIMTLTLIDKKMNILIEYSTLNNEKHDNIHIDFDKLKWKLNK